MPNGPERAPAAAKGDALDDRLAARALVQLDDADPVRRARRLQCEAQVPGVVAREGVLHRLVVDEEAEPTRHADGNVQSRCWGGRCKTPCLGSLPARSECDVAVGWQRLNVDCDGGRTLEPGSDGAGRPPGAAIQRRSASGSSSPAAGESGRRRTILSVAASRSRCSGPGRSGPAKAPAAGFGHRPLARRPQVLRAAARCAPRKASSALVLVLLTISSSPPPRVYSNSSDQLAQMLCR